MRKHDDFNTPDLEQAFRRYSPTEADQTHQLLKALGESGDVFTWCPSKEKGPQHADWPNNPIGLDAALIKMENNQNIGFVVSSTDDFLVIDLDRDATKWLKEFPILADAPQVYRDSDPDKLKVIFRNLSDHKPGRFALGSNGDLFIGGGDKGTQVIVAGVHPSGDLYKVRNMETGIPFISGDQLGEIITAMAGKTRTLVEGSSTSPFHTGRIDRTIPEGKRNSTLYRKARQYLSNGLTGPEVEAALCAFRDKYVEEGSDPITDDEIHRIIESALRGHEESDELRVPTDLDKSDLGNAQRFVDEYHEVIRYNRSLGWLVYEEGVWIADAELKVRNLAGLAAQKLYHLAAEAPNPAIAKEWAGWARSSLSKQSINSAIYLAQPHFDADLDEFDSHHELLNVRNGIVDLRKGTLMPHAPEYLMTQQANVAFDPDAECPKWLEALDMIFEGNAEIIGYVQRALGWSLTGRSDDKALFFMYGPSGNNGKSTIMELMFRLLGDYALKTNIQAVMKGTSGSMQPHLAEFRGKRFVVTSETEVGQTWSTAIVKDLTGNDIISANPKYKDPMTFKPTHTLWVYGNDKPDVDDTGDAFWKRLKTIPFNYQIPKEKQRPMSEVIGEFMEEAPGILNWLIEGYQQAVTDGLANKEPEAIAEISRDYRRENDPIDQFIEETDWVLDESGRVRKGILQDGYNKWLERQHEPPITATKLTKLLAKKNITVGGDGRRYYVGIRSLVDEPEATGGTV